MKKKVFLAIVFFLAVAVCAYAMTIQQPSITTLEVDGHTNGTNLTATQVSSTIIHNIGQGANAVTLNLPTAAKGYSFVLQCGEAQTSHRWRVRAGASDLIYLIAAAGTITAGNNNGYVGIDSPAIGAALVCWTVKTDAYDWACKPIAGTWTAE
jgi:hypothetical protein